MARHGDNGQMVAGIVRDHSETTVALTGELDLASVDELRRVLEREYEAGPSRLLVDLSQVEFVDSSTLNVFAVTEARLRDGGIAFELINPTAAIRRLLVITNLDQVLLTEEPERKGTT